MTRRIIVTDAPATPVILITAYADDGERIEVPVAARRDLPSPNNFWLRRGAGLK